MGVAEIARFLTTLATGRRVSASTQNQALNYSVSLSERPSEGNPVRGRSGPGERAQEATGRPDGGRSSKRARVPGRHSLAEGDAPFMARGSG